MTWVFCAGMIRSGSTLQYQLAAEIVERTSIGFRVAYSPEDEFDAVREQLVVPSQFKVFKAHVCTTTLKRECLEYDAKVVYSFRDIRDVAVSAMRKFGLSFHELVTKGWLDQAITDYYNWTSMPMVSISRYEELCVDIHLEVSKISAFLGSCLSTEDLQNIADEYGLEQQLARIKRFNQQRRANISSIGSVFDLKELLHYNHIHKGEVGGWRNLLSSTESSFLTGRYSSWLLEVGYDLE